MLLVVRGPIVRGYQPTPKRRRVATARLEEGYRVHLHLRARPGEPGIDMKGIDLETLNARLHISGKWFGVRSYPYKDFETDNITRVVIMMLDLSARKVTEEKVQFVWGPKVYSRLDDGKAPPSRVDSELDLAKPQRILANPQPEPQISHKRE